MTLKEINGHTSFPVLDGTYPPSRIAFLLADQNGQKYSHSFDPLTTDEATARRDFKKILESV